MEERKKRWGLLAFVAVGLGFAALASLSASAWATPTQQQGPNTVLAKWGDVCYPDPPSFVRFTFEFRNGKPNEYDWWDVVFKDDIDPSLAVGDVVVECDPGPCPTDTTVAVVGNRVRVTMAANPPVLPAGTKVTIIIECSIRDLDSIPDSIDNVGWVSFTDMWGRHEEGGWCPDPVNHACPALGWATTVYPQPCYVPEAGSLLLLGSGLAGLAGYAGLRLRVRRK